MGRPPGEALPVYPGCGGGRRPGCRSPRGASYGLLRLVEYLLQDTA